MSRWRAGDVLAAAESLRRAVHEVRLPLELEGAEQARQERTAIVDQLDDYLLPRLRAMNGPLLAVVGGSTGAGKSTLVNSVLRAPLSLTGVLRPTTRSPVLVHHPDDAGWFSDSRILPSLTRAPSDPRESPTLARRGAAGSSADGLVDDAADQITDVTLAVSDQLPAGLALLDPPDIDSVVRANRELARQLLAAADLWLFVTTAARYADAVPWDLLREAADRGVAVAVVLDRVPQDALAEIRVHLLAMLRERGHSRTPLFTITENAVDGDGLLAAEVVRPVRSWLTALAKNPQARRVVIRRTLIGAITSVERRVQALVPVVGAQQDARAELAASVTEEYVQARERMAESLFDGSLLRGEVLARWQAFVGAGAVMKTLESRAANAQVTSDGVARAGERGGVASSSRSDGQADAVTEGLRTAVHLLVTAQLESAVSQITGRWRATPGGSDFLERHPELIEPPAELEERSAQAVRDWQAGVLLVVTSDDRVGSATDPRDGIGETGVLLMVAVLGHAGDTTGAEVADPGGVVALARRLLVAVLGHQAVRSLTAKAQDDLLRRVDDVLATDRGRYETALGELRGGTSLIGLEQATTAWGKVR
ncbi:MAG: dynamin family protein [Angustibacter sp.]